MDNLFGFENHSTNNCVYYENKYKWCPEQYAKNVLEQDTYYGQLQIRVQIVKVKGSDPNKTKIKKLWKKKYGSNPRIDERKNK